MILKKYYKEFNNEKEFGVVLQKAEKIDANNLEVIWRLSRVYVDIGEKMPASNQ